MMASWKALAIRHLSEYRAMVRAVRVLPGEIRRCQSRAALDSDARLDALARRTTLQHQLKFAREQVAATEKALQLLTEEEYMVVEMLYIAPGRGHVERLCQELHCEQATIFRRRDSALRKITLALAGRG